MKRRTVGDRVHLRWLLLCANNWRRYQVRGVIIETWREYVVRQSWSLWDVVRYG